MIKVSSCFVALLLSAAVFAAPQLVSPPSSAGSVAPAAASSGAPNVASAIPVVASSAASGESSANAKSSNPSSTAPLPPSTASIPPSLQTVPFIDDTNPNAPLFNENTPGTAEAIRGPLGATIIGPINDPIDKQNPDFLAPPSTDHGILQNAKWPMSLSHNRLQTGGWAREQNNDNLPVATEMAGVNMRLEAGAIRELHWHTTSEWAYVIKGSTQITSVDSSGRNYVATVGPGDLWFFPAGQPHSLQGTADDPDGSEFLLVLDNGSFSDDDTFLLTDWMSHVPLEVLEKNFQTDASAFAHISAQQLYIFPGTPPPDNVTPPVSPQGTMPNPLSFPFSQVQATQFSGGSVKIVDSRTFKASTTIAAAEVTVNPGAVRELHWHPTQDEWSFFLEGTGRVTIFGAQSNARTFDYQAGDVGYIPASFGHYVENTGNTTLRYLEIFKTDVFEDISLSNWLALTPPELVMATLGWNETLIATLPKTKPEVVG